MAVLIGSSVSQQIWALACATETTLGPELMIGGLTSHDQVSSRWVKAACSR